jgi:hypothetical protein
MTAEPNLAPQLQPEIEIAAWPERAEQPIVLEIIRVLKPHPRGLRRWSVMRDIRNNREAASKDIPQKLEANVERIFRRFCAGTDTSTCNARNALFFRPQETAGEVWAVHSDRAAAWLEMLPREFND